MAIDPRAGRPSSATNGFEFNRPTIIGLTYLAGALTAGLASVIGIVLCYAWKRRPNLAWEATHYTYLARTFWIALAASVAGGLTYSVGIGAVILLAVSVWWTVRALMSLINAQKRTAMPHPESWLF